MQDNTLPPLVPNSSDEPQINQPTPVDPASAVDPYVAAVNDDASAYAQELAMQVHAPAQGDLIADDADLIEKEWVMRAKDVVARTSQDPHAQVKELNKIRAEYIKKRYNKDIKLSGE